MSDIGTDSSLLAEAQRLIDAATERGIVLRLLGGLAIQFLCPGLPPRTRTGQDLDLATVGSSRRALGPFLEEQGYVPDKMFNALNGDKQQYYTHGETGLAIDVLIDKLHMAHTLDFSDRLTRLPYTLDPIDLLLSKLQIFHLNEKDAEDCLRLMVSFEFADSEDPSAMDLRVFRGVVGDDWGWWKTVGLNLERIAPSWTPARRPPSPPGVSTPAPNWRCWCAPPRILPRAAGGACEREWASASAGTKCPTRASTNSSSFRPRRIRTCVPMPDWNTNRKGAVAEMEIRLAAERAGIGVYLPGTERSRADMLFEIGDGLFRVQCKWGRLARGGDVIVASLESTRRSATGYVRTKYSAREIDLFAVYCGELDRCFLLPIETCADRRAIQLRINPARNNQLACINLAEDFAFEGAIAQLEERLHGMQEVGGFEPA